MKVSLSLSLSLSLPLSLCVCLFVCVCCCVFQGSDVSEFLREYFCPPENQKTFLVLEVVLLSILRL